MAPWQFWAEVERTYRAHKNLGINKWRYGQTASNILKQNHPLVADDVWGSDFDPFYWDDEECTADNPLWVKFVDFIELRLHAEDISDED